MTGLARANSLRLMFGLSLTGVLVIVAIPYAFVQKWVGYRSLNVEVRVIETNMPGAVAGADVTIFKGARSPIEGRVAARRRADFQPDAEARTTQSALTDVDGIARFTYSLPAAGTKSFWINSGYVDTSQTWVNVRASNRPAALVPIDRQSIRPRDIRDLTPIVVTVVLSQCQTD